MRQDDDNMCTHPDSDELAALTFAAASGSQLTSEEQSRLLAAMAHCAGCRERMAQHSQLALLLPLSAPEAEPPPALRARILAAAARGATVPTPAPRPRARFSWRRALLPALSLALVVLLAWNVLLQQTVARQQAWNEQYTTSMLALLGDSDAQEFHLVAPEQTSKAYGRLFIAQEAGVVGVYVKRLPPLAPGRSYQLWLQGRSGPLNVATFQVNAEGRAWLIVEPSTPLAGYGSAIVTEEPAGGSSSPTGALQLQAELVTP